MLPTMALASIRKTATYDELSACDNAVINAGDYTVTNNNFSINVTLNNAQTLAGQVKLACPRSTSEFRALYTAIGSMFTALQETEQELESEHLDSKETDNLQNLGTECADILAELETYIQQYQTWGTNAQRSWDRMGYGDEQMEQLRQRMQQSTNALVAVQDAIGRLEQKLEKLVREIRAGHREGSVVSSRTVHRLDDDDGWRLLCRELEDIGISRSILIGKRQFIVAWFKDAVASGELDEHVLDGEAASLNGSDYVGSDVSQHTSSDPLDLDYSSESMSLPANPEASKGMADTAAVPPAVPTALKIAVENKQESAVRLLLDKDANIVANNHLCHWRHRHSASLT